MKKILLLMVVSVLLVLPSALALNCTRYSGDLRNLCGTINPLPISERDKSQLMQSNLYRLNNPPENRPNLQLNLENTAPITLEDLYEQKIIFIGRLALFILFNYMIFSLLNKSSFGRKWLTADY